MTDTWLSGETGYTLAETGILAESWLSASSLPDVLARPSIMTAPAADPQALSRRTVVIRKRGPEVSAQIQASSPMPNSFRKGVEDILELLQLPPGWNSYNAEAVKPQNAVRAIRLLAQFFVAETPPPAVAPTSHGGIQLEWHAKGFNIEIYIESPDEVSFFGEDLGSGEIAEETLAGHENELRAWLRRISGK